MEEKIKIFFCEDDENLGKFRNAVKGILTGKRVYYRLIR